MFFLHSTASDPEVNTISCSLCRRELGVWNFFPLTHIPVEHDDTTEQEAPSYLDTGQLYGEERSPRQTFDQEESCNVGGEDEQGNTAEAEKDDTTEPMEQSSDQADKTSTQDTAMDDYKVMGTSNTLTVKPHEPMGLKSPLHRSLTNLPGEETTESLCVEVENESLSERLQDVESELEFMGCNREGNLEGEDDGPRPKRRRLQVCDQLDKENSGISHIQGCC